MIQSDVAHGMNAVFWRLLTSESLTGLTVLDVGTGAGRVALALAPHCRRVVGIDRDAKLLDDTRRRAAGLNLTNVELVAGDAEAMEYASFAPDVVVAHLCMSDAIAERAGRALAAGRVFAFVAFHADHWRETGRRSRFAYDEDQARNLLARTGFTIEHLEVDRDVQTFSSLEEGLAAAIGLEEKWRSDGRWVRYLKFLEKGGRTLTRSHLVVKARRL